MDPTDETPNPIDTALEGGAPDTADDVIAGMDAALAAAGDAPADDDDAAPPPPAPEDGDEFEDDPDADPAKPGDADPAKPEGDKPADDPAAAKPDEPKPDDDIAKEAQALGLKDKANQRFVEMATEIKAFAPIRAELEKAGIRSVEDIPQLIERAKAAEDFTEMVMETGASGEQYRATLDYLTLVTRATQGDRQAAEKAFEMISGELKAMAEALGKEVPGVFDPLAAHADLQAEIAAGDLTRERALEIAQRRQLETVQGKAREQTTQQQAAQHAQIEQGRQALQVFDEAMQAADPGYLAIREQLSQQVAAIRQQLPPTQWVAATKQVYTQLKAAAAPPPPPAAPAAPAGKPMPSAMRPGGVRQSLAKQVFDSPLEAIDAALGQ
mgnify:CR=1 FL=1